MYEGRALSLSQRFISLIRALVNGDVACSMSWIRMTDTLNTCFTNCLNCKTIVVTDGVCYISGVQHDFLYKLGLLACIRRTDRRGAL